MNRKHAFILSLAIGVIAITGLFAATRTIGLGNGARGAANTQIAQRSAALDRYAASLRTALARPTKALPGGAAALPPAASGAAPTPVRVVYHRPPPIVVHVHRTAESNTVEGGESDD